MKQKGDLMGNRGYYIYNSEDANRMGIFITYSMGKPIGGKSGRNMYRIYQVYWKERQGEGKWSYSTMKLLPKGTTKSVKAVRTISFIPELMAEVLEAMEELYRDVTGEGRPKDAQTDRLIKEVGI